MLFATFTFMGLWTAIGLIVLAVLLMAYSGWLMQENIFLWLWCSNGIGELLGLILQALVEVVIALFKRD